MVTPLLESLKHFDSLQEDFLHCGGRSTKAEDAKLVLVVIKLSEKGREASRFAVRKYVGYLSVDHRLQLSCRNVGLDHTGQGVYIAVRKLDYNQMVSST